MLANLNEHRFIAENLVFTTQNAITNKRIMNKYLNKKKEKLANINNK